MELSTADLDDFDDDLPCWLASYEDAAAGGLYRRLEDPSDGDDD